MLIQIYLYIRRASVLPFFCDRGNRIALGCLHINAEDARVEMIHLSLVSRDTRLYNSNIYIIK